MAKNRRTNDLLYGHVGQAAYDSKNHQWVFGRKPGRAPLLQQLGSWKTVVEASATIDCSAAPHLSKNLDNAQDAAKALIKNYPEFAPGSESLPNQALVSAAVASTLATYDPAVGDLLVFGRVAPEARKRKKSSLVAAVPTGESGNILKIILASPSKFGWERDRSSWLEIHSLTEDAGYWVGDLAPIQQLCFAQCDDRSSYLAARFPTKTVLFHPIYHDAPQAPPRSEHYRLPPSRLTPRHVVSIRIDQTGGVPHADVTFNPEYQRQVGIVDQHGGWSVWDIDHDRRKTDYTVSCTSKGTISSENDGKDGSSSPRTEDGWARILWTADVNTILVCQRRKLNLFDIRGEVEKPTLLNSPEIISSRTADWILDVRKNPKRKHQFYILTSAFLHLVEVRTMSEAELDPDVEAGAAILVSWRHFRGGDDITLTLSLTPGDDEESIVLVHSRLNTLVTVFRFSEAEHESPFSWSASDPTELQWNKDVLDSAMSPALVTHFHLIPVQYGQNEQYEATGPGLQYISEGVQFYLLTATLSDFSVHECLVYALKPNVDETNGPTRKQIRIEIPNWQDKIQRREVRTRHVVKETAEDDGFIVPDEVEKVSAPVMIRRHKALERTTRLRRVSSEPVPNPGSIATSAGFDFKLTYCILASTMPMDQGQEQNLDIMSVLENVEDVLGEDPMSHDNVYGTLFDYSRSEFAVADIDQASSKLLDLANVNQRDVEGDAPSFELQRIAAPSLLQLSSSNDDEPSMASVYDLILQSWIGPLPANTPGRIRLVKERILRQIATEVMLASSRIHIREPVPQPATQISTSQSWNATVALHSSGSGKEREWNSSGVPSSSQIRPGSSQIIPSSSLPHFRSSPPPVPGTSLPTPEATPSLMSGTTFTSSSNLLENPVARLSRYLSIANPPTAMPSSIHQVLQHWKVGDDPATYDWEATTRAIEENMRADDTISARRREKLKRKAERLLNRQRRETALMKQKAESQPTPMALRSSPGPYLGGSGAGSSSQSHFQSTQTAQDGGSGADAGFGGVVASQVERGVHGGRPPVKKKKKVRRMGF